MLTDDQRTYQREWARRRRQNPEYRKMESQKQRKWQKSKPLTFGWYNDRRSAEKRQLEWTLTKERYEALRLQDCLYCGIGPNPTHGIDRRDNAKGYTEENSVTACSTCNFAKRRMSVDEFLSWARRLVRHNKEK